ncbi:hypothetical protein [Methyloradius palustris]|uniref:Uncharacterized protein n=1 Tax=Methyloradius palustris TaxID=2778876 RepID=A0A8D5JMU1_9PROT|nr:hypothetical protein [Methyloradius palustris]BCM26200.1 hypothetical protein ZMTM_24590 [Methyloradius palustris]
MSIYLVGIYVMHPDKSGFIEVNALNYDYANGVSLWLHGVYRNFAAKRIGRNDPLSWARAKVEIAEIIARDGFGKKRRTNAKIGRYKEAINHSLKAKQTKPLPAQATPKLNHHPVAPVTLANQIQQNMPKKFDVIIETRGK